MRQNKKETVLSLNELRTTIVGLRESFLSHRAIEIVRGETHSTCRRFVERDRKNDLLVVETLDGQKNGVKRDGLVKEFESKPFRRRY
jgi:hypothetical protein